MGGFIKGAELARGRYVTNGLTCSVNFLERIRKFTFFSVHSCVIEEEEKYLTDLV